MRALLTACLLAMALGQACAETPPAPSARPVGIIILKAVAGYPAVDVWFTSIEWTDQSSGYVIAKAGNKVPFVNDSIGRIIYFDPIYYGELDHNRNWIDWRAGIQNREAVLPPIPAEALEAGDARRLSDELAALQDAIDRYPNGADLVQPLIDTLKDEISKLSSGFVLQNGTWVSEKDAAAAVVPVIGQAGGRVTFTTTDGKRFVNAKVVIIDTGLSVLTDDGGSSVAFSRLPDDTSPFPKAVRDKIADWRAKQHQDAIAAESAKGWWGWISDTFSATVVAVKSYFSSPTPPPAGSTPPRDPAAPEPAKK